MSATIATILVGLGYDLSALEKGAPDAFRIVNQQTLGMSAEMKRASREGAESLRLIDEALGIHLSRPLTRILTQEFPGLAKGLQSILGAGVFGAIGVAGVEFVDKIAKSIEKAQKAQEDLRESSLNLDRVFAEEMTAYQQKDRAITAATAAVDRLSTAEEKQAKAAQEAGGWFTQTLAAIGDWLHVASSFQGTLHLEDIVGQLEEFKRRFDDLARVDAVKGSHESAKALAGEIAKARTDLTAMQSLKLTGFEQAISELGKFTGHVELMRFGFSQKDLDAQKAYIENLAKLQQVQSTTETGVRDQDAKAAALQRQAAAVRDLESLYRSIGESMSKLAPETDPLKKLGDEIRQMRYRAEADFDDLKRNSNDALQLTAARAALASYETNLDRIMAKARADADLADAQAHLPSKISSTTAAPQFASQGQLPTLGAGGTSAQQFDTFLKDVPAQLKLSAQAYQDLQTPQQKYELVQKELNQLLQEGLIDQTAYTAALAQAQEQMTKSTDQLQKLLEKTDSASAGMRAFFLQLENQGGKSGTGTFTFDLLNKGLQGFEDQTIKALNGGKTNWRSYFTELDTMAEKFLLNKGIADLLKGASSTSFGQSLGLDKLMNGGGLAGGGAAAATTANTTALTSLTTAVASLTATISSTAAAGGGGGSAGVIGDLSDSGIAAYAGGTDNSWGGLSMVGEEGPELVNLPSGSQVTPNTALRNGGATYLTNIDARGAQMGVAEQIARSWDRMAPSLVARAVVEARETQKRTPQ